MNAREAIREYEITHIDKMTSADSLFYDIISEMCPAGTLEFGASIQTAMYDYEHKPALKTKAKKYLLRFLNNTQDFNDFLLAYPLFKEFGKDSLPHFWQGEPLKYERGRVSRAGTSILSLFA